MMRRPVSILTVAMLLIAAPASAQLFPDIWPLSDDEDAHHPAMADLELLETLCTKGVLDEATCDETRRKMARSRLSGLHPRGELAVAYTADNQTQADEVVSYPGSPVDERGFRLTKASLGVEGSVYFPWLKTKWVAEARERDDGHYELELEYGQISVLCGPPAWQSETFSLAWNTTLGAMKIPFSRQSLTSTTQLQFIRRAMVVEEMPTRYDIGAQFDQEYALSSRVSGREIVKIDLNAGAFNGRGDRVYGPDNNDNLMYVGRARLDLIAPMRSGEGDTTPSLWPNALAADGPESDLPQLSLGASMLQNNDLTRIVKSWGVDAEARWGGLSVLAEMIRTRFEPEFDEGTVVEQYASDWETGGWFVQGGAFVIPRRVELAARYEEYYLELLDDVDERRLVAASTYGLNLHFASQHRMKLMTNYVRHVELEGLPQVDDDTWTVQGSLRF